MKNVIKDGAKHVAAALVAHGIFNMAENAFKSHQHKNMENESEREGIKDEKVDAPRSKPS